MFHEDLHFASIGVVEAIDELPELCSIYRADGLLMAINRANERVLGVSRDVVIGRFNMFEDERVLGAPRVGAYRRAFAGTLQVLPASRIQLTPSDVLDPGVKRPVLWLETTLVPLRRRADGQAPYVLGMSRDMTSLMEARDEIEAQRRTIEALEAAHREIELQRATIQALEAPVIEVWDGVVMLPLFGHLDDARVEDMTRSLLEAVTRTRARFVVVDLTGLTGLGSSSALRLIRLLRAVELLGARGLLAGIRPGLTTSLLAADIGLEGIAVHADLRRALWACIHSNGRR